MTDSVTTTGSVAQPSLEVGIVACVASYRLAHVVDTVDSDDRGQPVLEGGGPRCQEPAHAQPTARPFRHPRSPPFRAAIRSQRDKPVKTTVAVAQLRTLRILGRAARARRRVPAIRLW